LKLEKATGPGGISYEYLKYAHPVIVIYLRKLFNELLRNGYVPKEFGHGIIIPLIKDRQGNTSNIDNYRAITVSSAISKVFELCVNLNDKFKGFLTSHSLQFVYKKGTGCQDAVFAAQQTVNYFVCRGSTVFLLLTPVRHLTGLVTLNFSINLLHVMFLAV